MVAVPPEDPGHWRANLAKETEQFHLRNLNPVTVTTDLNRNNPAIFFVFENARIAL